MGKAPAFQFYVKDWFDYKVMRMSYEAQGVYMRILAYMWKDSPDQCSISKDEKLLARCLGISLNKLRKNLQEMKNPSGALFTEDEKRFYSKRLREEAEKQSQFRDLCSIAGKKSAEKRRKERVKDGSKDGSKERSNRNPTLQSSSSSSSSLKKVYTRFTPPTIKQVKEYIKEKRYPVNVDKWYDHYTANGWMVGKNKMKDWKAAVRTWLPESSGKTVGETDIERNAREKREMIELENEMVKNEGF